MRKGLRKIAEGLVAVGLCIVLSLTAAIPVCEAGPAEKVVKIGHRACFSGPLASTTCPAEYGYFDYIKHLNEQGGINGIKVELIWRDTRSDPARAISAHRAFKVAGVVAEACPDSGATDATLAVQARDEIPIVYLAGFDDKWWARPGELQWFGSYYCAFGDEFITFTKWASENWGKEDHPLRIGLMLADFIPGYSHLDKIKLAEKLKYTDEIGVEIVGYEMIPLLACIDTSTEWLRMATKKPDVIYVSHYGAVLSVVIKDAYRLEIQQKGIKLVGEAASMDEVAMRTAGAAAVEGWYAIRPHPCPAVEPDYPGVPIAVEGARRYRGMKAGETPSHYVAGWHHAELMIEAIRRAIEKVGFENLTGRAVRAALFSMSGFDIGIVPVEYVYTTEEKPWFIHAFRMRVIQGGRLLPYSDFFDEVILLKE